jgi:hypothetical protein
VRRAADVVRGLAILILLSALAPRAAWADGAFPDSENILTPADRPGETWLVTNFGVIVSKDGGTSWLWSCEQPGNTFGMYYQMAQPPRHRVFAVANSKVAFSDDDSCSWQTGIAAGQMILDLFADPSNSERVLAIGLGNQIYSVLESTDGGATFGRTLYAAPVGDFITGVEIAPGDPRAIYLTMAAGAESHSTLARSTDGGATWAFVDLAPDLGGGTVRLIAVDPDDAGKVFLLSIGVSGQALAIATGGGTAVAQPLSVDGYFNSFVRLPSGTILLGSMVGGSIIPALFRSRDAGLTFQRVAGHPDIRALSQRAGVVYAATDNFGDGYALATSSDEGDSWQPLMAYADVQAINPCLREQCRMLCETEPLASIWPPAVCLAGSGAGGAGGGGGPAGGSSGGAVAGSSGAGGGTRPPSSGGGCAVAAGPPDLDLPPALPGLAFLLVSLLWRSGAVTMFRSGVGRRTWSGSAHSSSGSRWRSSGG